VIPYGADEGIFFPISGAETASPSFRIVFAGQLVLRKGIRTLLEALSVLDHKWRLDCYGPLSEETRKDVKKYKGKTEIIFHGAVSAVRLAQAFRESSVLVLPSLEDGFGLVIPQALSCGLPCIVSNAVGAKDLIQHRQNGSVFPVKNYTLLAEELLWWQQNPARPCGPQPWSVPAEKLIRLSAAQLSLPCPFPTN
jgi:glycosyltransferase involved in cell wall biosynthesis